jgi:hypothetical protein
MAPSGAAFPPPSEKSEGLAPHRVPSFMTRAATWVANLRGAGRALAALILGALSVLAFAPVHAWPFLFFTFGGLMWLLDGCYAQDARLE